MLTISYSGWGIVIITVIVGFNIPLNTLQGILEMIFPKNHLTAANNSMFLIKCLGSVRFNVPSNTL